MLQVFPNPREQRGGFEDGLDVRIGGTLVKEKRTGRGGEAKLRGGPKEGLGLEREPDLKGGDEEKERKGEDGKRGGAQKGLAIE